MALPVKMTSAFGVLEHWSTRFTKNSKSQTNHNDQKSKFETCFGHLVLEFESCL